MHGRLAQGLGRVALVLGLLNRLRALLSTRQSGRIFETETLLLLTLRFGL
jgi:hypothetical protein